MSAPVETVRHIHKVIRFMLNGLEQAAGQTDYRQDQQVQGLMGQFQGLNGMLQEHMKHEDEIFFPPLDRKVGSLVSSYSFDHRGDEESLAKIGGLLRSALSSPAEARPALGKQVHREAIALNANSVHHMSKEEHILVPLLAKHLTEAEQWDVLKQIFARLPVEQFPMMMPGTMRVLAQDEREDLLRSFKRAMSPASFKAVVAHAPKGMSPDEWKDLEKRIPGLAA